MLVIHFWDNVIAFKSLEFTCWVGDWCVFAALVCFFGKNGFSMAIRC